MDISTFIQKDYVVKISDMIFYKNSMFANEQIELDCKTVMLHSYNISTITKQNYVSVRVMTFYVTQRDKCE